jgi:hypothetical protein
VSQSLVAGSSGSQTHRSSTAGILGQRSTDPVHGVGIKATGRIHHLRGLKQTPTGQETLLQTLVLMIDQGS